MNEETIDKAFEALIENATGLHAKACSLVADFVEKFGYEELEERLKEVECEYTIAVIKGYMPKPIGKTANGKKSEKTDAEKLAAYAKSIITNCEKKGFDLDSLVVALGYEL